MDSVLNNIELVIAILVGTGTILTGLYKAWKVINRKIIARHEENKARLTEEQKARDVINEIYKQLRPNGGSSLRDTIDSIDSRLYRVEKQQMMHTQVQQLIMLDSGLAVFETDIHGDCIRANRTYQMLVGRSEEELRGKGWVNFIEESDRQEVFEEWYQAVEQEREFHMTYTLVDCDHVRNEVNCKGFPLRDAEGRVTGYMGFIRKTEEKAHVNRTPANRPSLVVR